MTDQFKRTLSGYGDDERFVMSCPHCHQESGSAIPGLRYASKDCLGDPRDQLTSRKRVQPLECDQNGQPKSTKRGSCIKINDAEHSGKKCNTKQTLTWVPPVIGSLP